MQTYRLGRFRSSWRTLLNLEFFWALSLRFAVCVQSGEAVVRSISICPEDRVYIRKGCLRDHLPSPSVIIPGSHGHLYIKNLEPALDV